MASAPWYRNGTVAVTNGSTLVAGVQCYWLNRINEGDIFKGPDGRDYEVAKVTADGALSLRSPYLGASASAQAYAIVSNFTGTMQADVSVLLNKMLDKWHLTLDDFLGLLFSNAATATISDATGAARTVPTWTGMLAGLNGRLSKPLTGGTVTLSDTEAGNRLLDFSGVLTSNATVMLPAKASFWSVANATTGPYTLTLKTPNGAGVVVPQGGRNQLRCDGADVTQSVDLLGLGLDWMHLGDDPGALVRREALGSAAYMDWDVMPGGLYLRFAAAAETLTSRDRGRVIAAANGNYTLSLPLASTIGTGWFVWIKNVGSGTVTVSRSGTADFIDAGSSFTLAPNERRLVVYQAADGFMTL